MKILKISFPTIERFYVQKLYKMHFKQDDQEKTIRQFYFSGMWDNFQPIEKTLTLFHCPRCI